MSKSPYPPGCTSRNAKVEFIQEQAIQMAESGQYKNAQEIRQRLIDLKFGVLVADVISDDLGNFFDPLERSCRENYKGDIF